MRSLRLLTHSAATFADHSERRVHIACDPETAHAYLAYVDNHSVKLVTTNHNSQHTTELASFPLTNVIGLKYLLDFEAVCLALANGDIVLVKKDAPDYAEPFEVVGSVDVGIRAMSWSPDEEIVVMVTGSETILEMTKEFNVIIEFPINVENTGEDASVNVGWGRKETQFHGSEGKQAAQEKVDVQNMNFSEDDDYLPRVTWRGDGSLFACSAVDRTKGRRVIRIYNREGILQNTSEPVDKLEHALDWRPSGNLIAASQRLAHRHDIIFFEKNGLRHGEFVLREHGIHKVVEISWNADSTVLAVWIARQDDTTGAFRDIIQLWTMNNYHWYLKQEIGTITHEMGDLAGFQWDPEKPLRLHTATRNGRYQIHDYCWHTFISSVVSQENAAYVAVVDGSSVLLTPFRYQNVPPPMSSTSISIPSGSAVEVCFAPTHGGNDFAVLSSDCRVSFFDASDVAIKPFVPPKCIGTVELPHRSSNSAPRHIAWINPTTLLYVCQRSAAPEDAISRLTLQVDGANIVGVVHVVSKPFFERIVTLYANATHGDVLVETVEGQILEVDISGCEIGATPTLRLPEVCPWIETTRVGSNQDSRETVIIGLSERDKLYASTRLLASDCTSFFVHHDYLIFTTSGHTARFLSLNVSLLDWKLIDTTTLPYDESVRRVERGSRIILAIHNATNLILQMPRGNLETLSPRALVLSSIRDAIDRSDYRAAFLACRKHRVDLNILFDYSPSLFLEKIGTFVAHLQEVDFLNLFLSSLRNEDVTITMYPSGTQTKSLLQKADSLQSKVNTVCDAIRAVLVSLDTKHYIQSILSTYVRKTPPDYESALSLLASLRSDDLSHAEEALKYTIFLCDVDRLYDIALGMYDFSLVLMVAQQTQKDPREYLPFLQELQNLEVLYQRFKIDDHLQRHEKALLNLCLAGDQYFAEVVKYMQKHSLYQAALRAYRDKPVQKKVILAHYGEYLMERSAYGEAGIVFVMADSRKRALDAYQLAGAWREVFMLSRQLMFTEEDVVALAKELVGILQEKRLYTEAATVAADYGKDVEGAVDSLIKGYLWTEAARLSYLHGRDDLIQTNVIPGLIDGFSQITEDMAEMSDQFTKQTERLREIRAKTPDTSKEHDIPDDSLDNIDMFSDTTSMGSQFTRYTQATSRVTTMSTKTGKGSKNRRREERKRARGKKGSVFEEEYLVNSLKRLIQRAANFQNDIGNLLKALATYGFTEKGKAIQVSFDELLTELRASLDEIFVPLQLALNEADPPIQRISTDSPQVSTVIEKPLILDIEWKLPILQV